MGTCDVFMYNLAFCGENDEREEDHENTQHTHTKKMGTWGGKVWSLLKKVGDEINVTK